MKLRNTIILLIILAALGSYAYFFEYRKGEIERVPVLEFPRVFDFEVDAVSAVTINTAREHVQLARRAAGDWQLTVPVSVPADDARVEREISQFITVKATRIITDAHDNLAAFGLDAPFITVTFHLTDDTTARLWAGDRTPNNTQYYTRRDAADDVYLIHIGGVDQMKLLITDLPRKPTSTP